MSHKPQAFGLYEPTSIVRPKLAPKTPPLYGLLPSKFAWVLFKLLNIFSKNNILFSDFLKQGIQSDSKQKILFIIDSEVVEHHPQLSTDIDNYFSAFTEIQLVSKKIIIPGGEVAKNEEKHFKKVVDAININGIDRHSYVVAIGGGSVLDLVGYAAAVSHRGIKHIRIPTMCYLKTIQVLE